MFASYRRDDGALDPSSIGRSKHRFSPSSRKEHELADPLALRCDRIEFRSSSVWLVVGCILASLPELQDDLADSLVVKNIHFVELANRPMIALDQPRINDPIEVRFALLEHVHGVASSHIWNVYAVTHLKSSNDLAVLCDCLPT
jgi:hypothetical protein